MSVKLENLTGRSNEGKIKLAKISLKEIKCMFKNCFRAFSLF